MIDNRILLNAKVAQYERVGSLEIMKDEFEKTEEKTIKRDIYF